MYSLYVFYIGTNKTSINNMYIKFAEDGDDLPTSGLMKEIWQLQAATTIEAEADTDMVVKQSENIMFEDASIEEEIEMPTLMDETYDVIS